MELKNIRFNVVGGLVEHLIQKVHDLPEEVLGPRKNDAFNLVATCVGYGRCDISPLEGKVEIDLSKVQPPKFAENIIVREEDEGTVSFHYLSTRYYIHKAYDQLMKHYSNPDLFDFPFH